MKLFILLPILTAFLSIGLKAEVKSWVTLNGQQTLVHWNDGDSFRIINGPLKGTKTRLSGFNTLESYGAVHKFGGWDARELYIIAKKATNHNRGTHGYKPVKWECKSDMNKDGYGRILVFCDGMAESLLRLGLAHAMTIDKTPARENLLKAQRIGQKNKAGMWSKGIPDFVATSLHSIEEGKNPAYNRLVSSKDGHSEKVMHSNVYKNCEWVCLKASDKDNMESCVLYVNWKSRYGSKMASCLK